MLYFKEIRPKPDLLSLLRYYYLDLLRKDFPMMAFRHLPAEKPAGFLAFHFLPEDSPADFPAFPAFPAFPVKQKEQAYSLLFFKKKSPDQ